MNFRRALAGVAATAVVSGSGALVAAPAFAYTGDDEAVVATDTRTEPGDPITVIVEAGVDSAEASLTVTSQNPNVPDSDIAIAGTQSMTKPTVAGAAEFEVTLYSPGRYNMVGRDEDGKVVGRTMVIVTGPDTSRGGEREDAGAAAGANTASMLPATGTDTTTSLLAAGGGALVLGGAAAMALSRRRKAQLD